MLNYEVVHNEENPIRPLFSHPFGNHMRNLKRYRCESLKERGILCKAAIVDSQNKILDVEMGITIKGIQSDFLFGPRNGIEFVIKKKERKKKDPLKIKEPCFI